MSRIYLLLVSIGVAENNDVDNPDGTMWVQFQSERKHTVTVTEGQTNWIQFDSGVSFMAAPSKRCEKIAIYHRDAMNPYGFGCQYNTFTTFLLIASLSGRIPLEEGPWRLGCESSNKTFDIEMIRLPTSSGPKGFNGCRSRITGMDTACKSSETDSQRLAWNEYYKGNKDYPGRSNELRKKLLFDKITAELPEWHIDGDVTRNGFWHLDQKPFDCNKNGPVGAMYTWTPLKPGTFAHDVCTATGLSYVNTVDLKRYVARHLIKIDGFSEARQRCRQMWDGKTTLAIHVRRGDKVIHEDRKYEVAEYLNATRLRNWVFDNIHIATDDPVQVGAEAESLGLKFTMLAKSKMKGQVAGLSKFLTDLACMVEADFLVGSSHSNVPWLAMTWREQAVNTTMGTDSRPLGAP